ncbi:MAG: copper chaperone PCu(A)C [Chloroflexi bacterium]|nr:copper chaperone PCu(A)C [Chloroflexota bacterium]
MSLRKVLFLLVLVCLFVPAVFAQEMPAAPEIVVTGAWARNTALEHRDMSDMAEPMDMSIGGVFIATVENLSAQPVRLISGSTPVSGIVELHQTTMENDVMSMGPLEGGVEIPAGAVVELESQGVHFMLVALNVDLVLGDAFSFTLVFELPEMNNETFEVVIGVPVLEEAPAAHTFAFFGLWARPTVAAPSEAEMGGMQMGDATPEATEAMGGMQMGDATPEATEAMGGMQMGDATPEATEAMGGMSGMQPRAGVSAVYMQIINRGASDDRLIAASTTVANLVQIHESRLVDDVMQMSEVEGGLPLPVGERVLLQPGGFHIMLMDLQQELVPGTAFLLTLTFESGAEITLAVPVYNAMQMG